MKFSKLDVLINNAGIASDDDEFNATIARKIFATNYYGAIHCTSSYLPLLQQSENGKICMMSSRIAAITKLSNAQIQKQLNSDTLQMDELNQIIDAFFNDLDGMESA